MSKRLISVCALIVFILTFLIFSSAIYAQQKTSDFRVLDISERTYEGGPAVAVLLSQALNPRVRHDRHLRISDQEEMLKSVWVLSDDKHTLYYPHVQPETKYSVSVLDSLESAEGQQLGQRVSKVLETRKMPAGVSFATNGFILPSKLSEGLPVASVNVQEVNIEFFRINDQGLVSFVDWSRLAGKKGYYQLRDIGSKYGELVYSARFELEAPENKRVIRHISVEDIKDLNKPGVYIAVMRKPGEYEYNFSCAYFLVTDIGLQVRVYARKILVVASSIKTGKPIQGANLEFLNQESRVILQGKTGPKGLFEQDSGDINEIRVLKAKAKGQIGILPLKVPALDMSAFELGKREFKEREVFLYSPRDLYRPGEKMVISGLLRDYAGRQVPAMPLKADLIRPDNRKVSSFTWQPLDLNASGLNYYQKTLDIPPEAQTGKWSLEVRDNPGSERPAGKYSFHVEEFMPERMKLELKSDQERLSGSAPFKIEVGGEYLYGAPAAENVIQSRVFVKANRHPFTDLEDFEFGLDMEKDYTDFRKIGRQRLNQEGKADLEIKDIWSNLNSPMAVHVTLSLLESGGRPVKRTIKRDYLPASELLGIRKLFDEEKIDQGPVSFELVNVDNQGNFCPAENLMLKIIKKDRDYYWEYSEARGWSREYTEKNYVYLSDSLSLKAQKAQKYTAQLERGRYLLKVRNPETGQVSSTRFSVGFWWGDAGAEKGGHPDKVLLKLDKRAYQPGDLIKLTVTPPHSGQVLILVEGDRPLWSKRIKASAQGTVVEIPFSAAWDREDIYISAVAFRPARTREKIAPNRAVGLIHLPVDRSKRELALSIDTPKKVSAQKDLQVKLTLDKNRTEAFVTLAAVDVGVLNITEMKRPRPFEWFFAQRRYDVLSYDIYGKIIEMLEGEQARIRYGGDADLGQGGKRPETKVEIISLFKGPVRFDAQGEAHIDLKLPNFNGRLRLMAVAFTRNKFGSAKKEVQVAAPVVTQLATPRFLAPGDETEFTLDVHNLSGQDRHIELEMQASEPLRLTKGQREFSLADQQKKKLRFGVQAGKVFGSSRINLQLKSKDFELKRDWHLGVRPGYPGVARKRLAVLGKSNSSDPGESLKIDGQLTADLMPSTLEADIKISPVIALNLGHALQGLVNYPYGCLEQTISSVFPLIYAREAVLEKLDLPEIEAQKRLNMLKKGIERISSMQKPSGGFGSWSRESREAPWLSVNAVDFLLYAREQGLEVPGEMLQKALKRIQEYFLRGAPVERSWRKSGHFDFAVRSYAGYVLSRLNRASLGTLRTLYDNHKQEAKSRLPLIQLAIALYNMGDLQRGKAAVQIALDMSPKQSAAWSVYGSALRDTALGLALLLEYEIENRDLDGLMLKLQDELRAREYLSTQEKLAIFRAGVELADKANKKWSAELEIGSETRAVSQKGPYVFEPDLEEIQKGIEISSAQDALLFASTVVTGYTKNPPQELEAKMSIKRRFYDLKGQRLEKRKFNIGDMILVRLDVSAQEMLPDALVVDLLPAGVELENQNLGHSLQIKDIEIEGEAIWKMMQQVQIKHQEYRDDRYVCALVMRPEQEYSLFYLVQVVSPGKFSVPPPMAESMYMPEIRAIGRAEEDIRIVNSIN